MANNYQTLGSYSGSLYGEPRYNGVEYDFEVPDNLVVGSPGGVSTIHHHYTKGFNGRGNTSSDVYAGQGQRYNSGEFGNLYQTGQTASQSLGYYNDAPDYQFWQNEEPQQYSYTQAPTNVSTPMLKHYGQKGAYQTTPQSYEYEQKKSSQIENFTGDTEDYELFNDDGLTVKEQMNETTFKIDLPLWLLFLILLLGFIVLYFWKDTLMNFIKQTYYEGKDIPWKMGLVGTFISTILFVIVIYFTGIR